MRGARLLQSALCGGLLWSGAEIARLLSLDLLGFSEPWRLALFIAAHGGLCVGGAIALGVAYAAPAVLGARRGLLLLWVGALAGLTIFFGIRLSFRVAPPHALPACASPAVVFALLLARDLPDLRAGRPIRGAPRAAALCALGAAAACAINQRYLPQQLFHFHAAVSSFGLGLATLAAAYALPRARRAAGAAALLLLLVTAAAVRLDGEVRHALFVLGQESRALLYALRKGTRSAGGLEEGRGAEPAAAVPLACGPPLVRRVLLVTIDALRADHLRAYGYGRETAPHLSALAGRAVLFEHAFALAPSTSPAVRRLFSVEQSGGRPLSRLGEALRGAGVRARAVTAIGMSRYFGEGVNRAFAEMTGVPVRSDVVDRALAPVAARLLGQPAEGPELFWVHLAAPHLPYLRWPEGPDFGPRPMDRYDGEIAESDRALGRILLAAAAHPLAASTAIVVTADHGEELGDHGGEAHGRYGMWSEEIHVPLLIALPGVPPRRVADNVSHDDLAPTLAALLGACGPGFRGRSLLGALRGAPLPTTPILVGPHSPFLGGALIVGRWKLTFVLFNRSLGLYDLAADPRERLNLVERRPEVAAALHSLLRAKLAALPPGWRQQDQ